MLSDVETAMLLAALLDNALDDCRIRLGPQTSMRLRQRLAELVALRRYALIVTPRDDAVT